MGLFSKDNPAEKKLKELTGSFLLSNSFVKRLKQNNIDIKEGTKIKEQLKEEIKEGSLDEFNIESRLNQLINSYSDNDSASKGDALKKRCPKCLKSQESSNNVCIYCGHEFYPSKESKKCPECNEIQQEENAFCTNCGYNFAENKQKKKCPICDELLEEIKPFLAQEE